MLPMLAWECNFIKILNRQDAKTAKEKGSHKFMNDDDQEQKYQLRFEKTY